MYTIISDQRQADQAAKQLAHVTARTIELRQESESIREDITRAVLEGDKTVPLLTKRSKVDADLNEMIRNQHDLDRALTDWQTVSRIQAGRAARLALEEITAEGRAIEQQYVALMTSVHEVMDQIDEIRKRYQQALVAAKENGGLAPTAGTGRSIAPIPSYPRMERPITKRPREIMPANLPPVNISLDEYHDTYLDRKGA